MVHKWGWVPNLSGNACSYETIAEKIDRSMEVNGFRFSVRRSTQDLEAVVSVSNSTDSYDFDMIDPSGLCTVQTDPDDVMVEMAWAALRKLLDGCSGTMYDCTAMSGLISGDSVSNPYHIIVRTFMSTLESQTDVLTRVMIHGPFRLGLKNKGPHQIVASFGSNSLYLESFIRIYREEMDPLFLERMEGEMALRQEKVSVAYDYLTDSHRIGYNLTATWIAAAALVISFCVGMISVALDI